MYLSEYYLLLLYITFSKQNLMLLIHGWITDQLDDDISVSPSPAHVVSSVQILDSEHELPLALSRVADLLRGGSVRSSIPTASNNCQGRCYSLPKLSPPNCKCFCSPGQVRAISGGGCGKYFSCSAGRQVPRRCCSQHCLQRHCDMDQGIWTYQ